MNNSPKAKGIRTAIQTFIATFVVFFTGLFWAVWNVPGVPEAVAVYVSDNLPTLAAGLGISTGAVSGLLAYVWNRKS